MNSSDNNNFKGTKFLDIWIKYDIVIVLLLDISSRYIQYLPIIKQVMCGRFSRFVGTDILTERFDVDRNRAKVVKSYNIAPSQDVPVIIRENPVVLEDMRWGFIPFWAETLSSGPSPINARDDSLGKNMYNKSLQSQRCFIPANGFYEWKKMTGKKQPFYIRKPDEDLLAFAGIYSIWRNKNKNNEIKSFAIITTSANKMIKNIHDRMPVILHKSDEQTWLDPNTEICKIKEIIQPYDGDLEVYPVSTYVNSPRHDDEKCIDKINEDRIGKEEGQRDLDDFF